VFTLKRPQTLPSNAIIVSFPPLRSGRWLD
jgi:hypothetical protein